jgi:hypothetical protein
MELWILATAAVALIGLGVVTRLRRARRAPPREEKNIYPLW